MADLLRRARPLSAHRGYREWFATEDGKHYRGMSMDVDTIKRHVRRRNDQANSRRGGLGYRGSIPWPLQIDWAKKNHYTIDQIARNEDRSKEKMMKHFSSNEYRALWANDYRAPK